MTTAPPVILDCTIRDGSYAIDFKFTAQDTALIAELLEAGGLRYIEIGHGLGLGASEAGKGRAGSKDLEVISLTRSRVKAARIGVFFIPGVGSEQNLRDGAAAGLDFVRLGNNADEIESVWPYMELAHELGVEPFVNFMKTYGISPGEFGHQAALAGERGAAGVYVVDSAGGMLPSEVKEYVHAARESADIPIGFHGHSNLQLAVANAVAAYEAGATFIDTSVFGIGRSSGNVPTEVMAAVFDRMGIDSGVDALAIIDLAESYLRPLADHLHPHTMLSVSLGYGQFHSAFVPKALTAADESEINPFRLIVALGQRDVMNLPEDLLNATVDELKGVSGPVRTRLDLAQFSDPRFGPRRIGNRPEALPELLDGLEVVAAKRHLDIVLDLVFSPVLDEEALVAEFVLEDDDMALGRLRFGSVQTAAHALAKHSDRLSMGILDCAALESGDALTVAQAFGPVLGDRIVPYSSSDLELEYLGDAALSALARGVVSGVLIVDPGSYAREAVDRLAERLGGVAPTQRSGPGVARGYNGLIVVAGPAGSATGPGLDDSPLPPIHIGDRRSPEQRDARTTVLAKADAYRGTLARWRKAMSANRASVPEPAAA